MAKLKRETFFCRMKKPNLTGKETEKVASTAEKKNSDGRKKEEGNSLPEEGTFSRVMQKMKEHYCGQGGFPGLVIPTLKEKKQLNRGGRRRALRQKKGLFYLRDEKLQEGEPTR